MSNQTFTGPGSGLEEWRENIVGTGLDGFSPLFTISQTDGSYSTNLAAPTGVTAVLASGGSLTQPATYYYTVTALNQNGESQGYYETTGVATTSGNQTINLAWPAVKGALSYNIYRSTTAGLSNYGATSFLANSVTLSYSDTGGTALTSGTPPTVNTATNLVGANVPTNPYGRVYSTLTPVSTTANATTQTLGSFSLPPGMLATNGWSVKFRAWGSTAANTDTKTLFVTFGATTVSSTAAFATSGTTWYLEGEVFRTGATSQSATGFSQQAAISALTQATPAETLANSIALAIKATQGTASIDVTMAGFVVELAL